MAFKRLRNCYVLCLFVLLRSRVKHRVRSECGQDGPSGGGAGISFSRKNLHPGGARLRAGYDSPIMTAPFDLDRFVAAQAQIFDTAFGEIRRGAKRSHWMWFIFPQIAGLGSSEMARRYAIGSLDEARAYLAHPVLGARLRDCVAALQDLTGTSAEAVFGGIDALKLRSSLTLFAQAGGGGLFIAAIDRWFNGEADPATLARLGPR